MALPSFNPVDFFLPCGPAKLINVVLMLLYYILLLLFDRRYDDDSATKPKARVEPPGLDCSCRPCSCLAGPAHTVPDVHRSASSPHLCQVCGSSRGDDRG